MLRLLVVTCLTLTLVGCATHAERVRQQQAYSPTVLRNDLDDLGTQVVRVGQQLTIVMPTQHYFNPDSANLSSKGGAALDLTVQLLNRMQIVALKVTGYTASTGWEARNLQLSKQRAEHIASYLWHQGIDVRLVVATGVGSEDPIATNATALGRADNNRVVLTGNIVRG